MVPALRSVRENIAAFGGDLDNVTLFRQSAGAAEVLGVEPRWKRSPRFPTSVCGCRLQAPGVTLPATRLFSTSPAELNASMSRFDFYATRAASSGCSRSGSIVPGTARSRR